MKITINYNNWYLTCCYKNTKYLTNNGHDRNAIIIEILTHTKKKNNNCKYLNAWGAVKNIK